MGRLARQGALCVLAMALAAPVQAQPAARVQGLAPTEVRPGGLVTIRGAGFGADRRAVQVHLGGVAVPLRAVSPTAIQFTVPPQAQSGAVVVTVAGRQLPRPQVLRVIRPMRLASIRPPRGGPGTEVTLEGQGFDVPPNRNRVTLSGVACRVVRGSGSALTLIVPQGARTGPLVVVNAAGQRVASPAPFVVTGAPTRPVAVSGQARPTIDRFEPRNGPPGTVVRILGRNFERGSRVFLNGRQLRVTEAQTTRLSVQIPAGSRSGNFSVRGRYTVESRNRFVVEDRPSPPRIVSFSPQAGAPGVQVTLRGERFGAQAHQNRVTLGGQPCVVRRASPGRLVVEVPRGVTAGRFVVRVPGAGEATSAREFTAWAELQVTAVEPAAAPVGARVTIRGQGFAPTLAQNQVSLNGRSLRLTQAGPSELVFVVPPRATSGPLEVRARGVRRRAPAAFRVTTPPQLRRFTPTAGAPGTEVTLSGRNFGSATGELTVHLAGRDCAVVSARGTQVRIRIPRGAQSGRFQVTRAGQGSATSRQVFTAYVAVTIRDFTPHRAPAGSEVLLRGTGFGERVGLNTIRVGSRPARILAAGAEEIRFRVPTGVTQGKVRVEVRGRGAAESERELILLHPPVVQSFTPTAGAPGSAVTLAGRHFGRAANKVRVTLAGRPCPVTSVGPRQLSVTLPQGAESGFFEVTVGRRGTARSARRFGVTTPIRIANFTPTKGPPGTEVLLRGEGFAPRVAGNAVHLGSKRVRVLAAGPSKLRVRVPPGASTGPFKVKVRSRQGPRRARSEADFRVTNPLQLARIEPQQGPPGTEVTLHGRGFRQPGLKVSLGERPLAFRQRTKKRLVVTIPAGATTGPVVVRVAAGAEVRSARPFTVVEPARPAPPKRVAVRPGGPPPGAAARPGKRVAVRPGGAPPGAAAPRGKRVVRRPRTPPPPAVTVRSFSPVAGPPGTVVQLQGSGFGNDPRQLQVWLGSVAVPVVALRSGNLTVRVPPNARGGPWRVRRASPQGVVEGSSRGPFRLRRPRR